jgi:hypothetical protein
LKKLSPFQMKVLIGIAKGVNTPPSGYPTAGRDASAWWRSVEVLERHGLVTKAPESNEMRYYFRILTEAGKDMACAIAFEKGRAA